MSQLSGAGRAATGVLAAPCHQRTCHAQGDFCGRAPIRFLQAAAGLSCECVTVAAGGPTALSSGEVLLSVCLNNMHSETGLASKPGGVALWHADGTAVGGPAQHQHRRAGFKSWTEMTVHGASISGSAAEVLPAHLEHTSLAMRQRKLADASVQTQPSVPDSLSSASMLSQLLGDVRPWGNRTVAPTGKLAENFLRNGLGAVQPQGAKPGLSVMSSA